MSLINNKAHSVNSFSFGEFVWWIGVVEDRKDPEELGRLKVRIYGYHNELKEDIPTEDLFWATVVQPINSASFGGIGTSPTGIIEGSTVVGFFMDGHNAQAPVIFGTIVGKPSPAQPGGGDKQGFRDPEDIYSRYNDGEVDTNRLATDREIDKTVVQWRKDKREKEIDIALGGTYEEPETEYAPKYPYNHVYESEPRPEEDVKNKPPPENCGHIEEYDDTPDKERYFHAHKKGTFLEIYPDGTIVRKSVKDRYVIINENDHLYVKGDWTVTVDGNAKILIKGNADIEIKGNVTEKVGGNYELEIGGNYDVTVGGHHYDEASHRKIEAGRVDIN